MLLSRHLEPPYSSTDMPRNHVTACLRSDWAATIVAASTNDGMLVSPDPPVFSAEVWLRETTGRLQIKQGSKITTGF